MSSASGAPTVVYVHGAGNQVPQGELKRRWDQDLFGMDMGERTRMVYYADLLHARPSAAGVEAFRWEETLATLADVADTLTGEAESLGGLTPRGQELALSLSLSMAARAPGRPVAAEMTTAALLPLPSSLRRLLLRQVLRQFVPDADGYFFAGKKEPIRSRLRQALDAVSGPVVVVSHSLGTVVTYDTLSEPRFAGKALPLLVTLGSPLGYPEIQEVAAKPLRVPSPVRKWANFADPFDIVTVDTTLADDFGGVARVITDTRVDNRSPNNHASGGYLRTSQVRSAVAAVVSV